MSKVLQNIFWTAVAMAIGGGVDTLIYAKYRREIKKDVNESVARLNVAMDKAERVVARSGRKQKRAKAAA